MSRPSTPPRSLGGGTGRPRRNGEPAVWIDLVMNRPVGSVPPEPPSEVVHAALGGESPVAYAPAEGAGTLRHVSSRVFASLPARSQDLARHDVIDRRESVGRAHPPIGGLLLGRRSDPGCTRRLRHTASLPSRNRTPLCASVRESTRTSTPAL